MRVFCGLGLWLLLSIESWAQQPALMTLPGAYTPAPQPSPRPHSPLVINQYYIKDITIDDLRPTISDRPIKMSMLAGRGKIDKVWPALTPEQQAQIRTLLEASFQGDTAQPAVTLRCQIIDAYQLFGATGIDQNVEAYFKVGLELVGAQGQIVNSTTSEARVFQRTLDAKHWQLDKFYEMVLAKAMLKGVHQLASATENE